MSILEILFVLFVALFVFFGLCALREFIIKRFIAEYCEVIDHEMDPTDPTV